MAVEVTEKVQAQISDGVATMLYEFPGMWLATDAGKKRRDEMIPVFEQYLDSQGVTIAPRMGDAHADRVAASQGKKLINPIICMQTSDPNRCALRVPVVPVLDVSKEKTAKKPPASTL